MSIGKIIKTGLAIYGGTILAKKIGRYLFVKNKDKIVNKIREKIMDGCNKAIDDVFRTEKKEDEYKAFLPGLVMFDNPDEAFNVRAKLCQISEKYGKVTVADFKDLTGRLWNIADQKMGWHAEDIYWLEVPVERTLASDGTSQYFLDTCCLPTKLEE